VFKVFLATISLVLASVAATADVYIWRDAQGALKHSDTPPGERARDVRKVGSTVKFLCAFANSPSDCGFQLQAKARSRASIARIGSDGRTGLRLRTEPGDNNVFGSGANERVDVYLSQADTGCHEGREQWWAHSILFPDDFVPSGGWGAVVFDFHNTSPGPGQANLEIDVGLSGMSFSGYGGAVPYPTWRPPDYSAPIGPVVKNVWYDFIYHVKWSSNSDGFFYAWVNGIQKLAYTGPTLYSGQDCYLKLANYHTPTGLASSVIHGRVTRQDVGEP
jgi:Polysaccharide lyase/Domain of unknown function (DUF4124)